MAFVSNALSLTYIGTLIGGLGLFLLAVSMMTDGLRLAAGESLRDLLGKWTRTPLHGLGAGALITAIVQSSSAVTVATIGFVNANLLSLRQALGVVYGTNIGTTMTGWLVSIVGFNFKIELFALPMIGAGMLLRISGANTRRAPIGEAIAGFGLFFIGVSVLRGAFEDLAHGIDLTAINSETPTGLMLFAAAGFAMTLLTQSSSAAIAITLTAATGGIVALPAAAAMVIGANVGTTSTAVLAALGATANAKRVATAHVTFNVLTGAVALLTLPLMLWLVAHTGQMLKTGAAPAVALALFHTLFNILGVLLLWPFTKPFAAFLARRFGSTAELLEKPKFIDATTSGTPAIALDAIRLELRHIVELTRRMAVAASSSAPGAENVGVLHQAVMSLNAQVEAYVSRMERARMTKAVSEAIPVVLRATHQIDEAADAALSLTQNPATGPQTSAFLASSAALLSSWQPETVIFEPALRDRLAALKLEHEQARDAVLAAAATGQITATRAHQLLEHLRYTYRMVEQLVKAARRIKEKLPGDIAAPEQETAALVATPVTAEASTEPSAPQSESPRVD